jgi:hypothetical protein
MILTNTIGAAPGLKLRRSGNDGVNFGPAKHQSARTNVLVRNLQNPGSVPSTIKILSLTGSQLIPGAVAADFVPVSNPILVADVSALGAQYKG